MRFGASARTTGGTALLGTSVLQDRTRTGPEGRGAVTRGGPDAAGAEAIVTRNGKDFAKATLPVLTAREALGMAERAAVD